MGKSAPSPPAPTPPGDTAAADFGAEAATAGHAAAHGLPNQSSPGGSVQYTKYDLPDVDVGDGNVLPGGKGVSDVTTAFNPTLQGVWDTLQGKGSSIAGLLPTTGFTPNINNADLRQSYINEGLADAQPEWARQDTAQRVDFANRGIPIDSEIYRNEMNRVGEQRNDALQSLTNQAHGAAAQDAAQQFGQQLTQHNTKFGDFANFGNALQTMQANLQGRDSPLIAQHMDAPNMAQIVGNYDNAKMQAYQAQMAGRNAGMGGVMQAGGALLGMFSDARVKDDIAPIGKTFDGQNIYRFKYKGDDTVRMGLMAQEVEQHTPEAVGEVGGIKTVDYGRATEPSLAALLRSGEA